MLMTGYNLVRGSAIEDFRAACSHRFGLAQPETLSVTLLLRHIYRQEPLPHRVVQVTGFPDLWRVCPDTVGLTRTLRQLFFEQHMNWLRNQNPYIYFVLSDEITFNNAAHLDLRLAPKLYADMTLVFGHMRQISADHYHHNFIVSEV